MKTAEIRRREFAKLSHVNAELQANKQWDEFVISFWQDGKLVGRRKMKIGKPVRICTLNTNLQVQWYNDPTEEGSK